MFKLKEQNKKENIDKFCMRAEKLRELSVIKEYRVVKNTLHTAVSNYDVALVFDFDSLETLEEYQS